MSSQWSHMQKNMHCTLRSRGDWDRPREPADVLLPLVITLAGAAASEFKRGMHWVLDERAVAEDAVVYDRNAVAERLAAFVVGLGDAAEWWNLELTPKSFPQMRAGNPQPLTDMERLFKPIALLSRAAAVLPPVASLDTAARLFTQALDAVIDAAAAWGMDLQGAVFAQMEKNRRHPHGEKD